MSRNLGRIDCDACPGTHDHVILEEEPRLVTRHDVGGNLYGEYNGMVVARARCVLCHALYLAWVNWPSSSYPHWRLPPQADGKRFFDLSYRHAFNDEPAIEDTPLFEVEVVRTYVRRPAAPDAHSYRRTDYGDEEYRENRRQQLERWKARQDAAVASKLSPSDEIARD